LQNKLELSRSTPNSCLSISEILHPNADPGLFLSYGPEDGPTVKKDARSTGVFNKKSHKQMARLKRQIQVKPQVKKSQIMMMKMKKKSLQQDRHDKKEEAEDNPKLLLSLNSMDLVSVTLYEGKQYFKDCRTIHSAIGSLKLYMILVVLGSRYVVTHKGAGSSK
jgi:hypothetical protein